MNTDTVAPDQTLELLKNDWDQLSVFDRARRMNPCSSWSVLCGGTRGESRKEFAFIRLTYGTAVMRDQSVQPLV
jgi:hypothetical protein